MSLENKIMPQFISEKVPTLTKREQSYFRMMWGKSGVLYITAKPGVAKSAIARSIAQKMGFRYMDILTSLYLAGHLRLINNLQSSTLKS